MREDWTRKKGDRRRVVVVGAGVAGMTCAHELVERGYEVEVVEAALDPYHPSPFAVPGQPDRAPPVPLIGGMARTAWARVPPLPHQAPVVGAPPGPGPRVTPWSPAGKRIEADRKPLPITPRLTDALAASGEVRAFVGKLAPGDELLVIASHEISAQQQSQLESVLGHRFALTIAESDPELPCHVQISVAGARVPGEHGFRFFPSFYHHLFDTMKRIPIPEAAIDNPAGSVFSDVIMTMDSSRSLFDALLSAEVIQLGLVPGADGPRTFEIARRPMRSPQDLRTLFADVLERAGYRGQDLHRLITRYVEYLTSAPERRLDYERISWASFLGLGNDLGHGLDHGYSPQFVRHVNSGAQALVAMASETNDARTIGSIAMQLTLDQVRANPGGYTDATLRGPTSIELFEPWRAYLESESVRFTCAQLVGFEGVGMVVRPVFGHPGAQGFAVAAIDPADYYVITVPVDKFQALFDERGAPVATWATAGPQLLTREQLRAANQLCLELDRLERRYPPEPAGESSDDIAKLLDFPTGDVEGSPDTGPLRYMCGIQFYFEADVKVILGHTVCLDSPWGVSHISQAQYWQDRSRGQSGIRGVISAIFTRFEVEACDGTGQNPRTALACTPDEVADRVWKQIADAWDDKRYGPLPDPDYYFIDESLTYDHQTWHNATPYLVNHVGHWPRRGGLRTADCDYTYRVQLGHTVFAGAFMRTFTRLNTMEAANETGRRAANAIVQYDHAPVQLAQIWNLEDHELPEVLALRELDRRIARRGGHHILRHAGVEAALRAVPWDLVRLFLPTRGEGR